MEKIPDTLECVDNNNRSTKRGYGLLGKVNEIIEAQPHSSKQSKEDDEEANAEDRDYEEWKKRILESAAKAMASKSTGKKNNEKTNS